jgi:hypothetical protein
MLLLPPSDLAFGDQMVTTGLDTVEIRGMSRQLHSLEINMLIMQGNRKTAVRQLGGLGVAGSNPATPTRWPATPGHLCWSFVIVGG